MNIGTEQKIDEIEDGKGGIDLGRWIGNRRIGEEEEYKGREEKRIDDRSGLFKGREE
jgi:hypothetical protein